MPYITGLYYVKLTMSGMDYSAIILCYTVAEGIGDFACKILSESIFQQSGEIYLKIVGRDLVFTVNNIPSIAYFELKKMC